MHFTDTSFLLSLYGEDVHSETARSSLARSALPLQIHHLNDFEFANALRALVFRNLLTPEEMQSSFNDYELDKKRGFLQFCEIDANSILQMAESISTARTVKFGNRSYDILLVAAAKLHGASRFWTFDSRQRDLAMAEGLDVGP